MVITRGVPGLIELKETYDLAFSESAKRFPDIPVPPDVPPARAKEWQLNDGHRDAFRHTFWNALLAKEFGQEWATSFATAHEGLPLNPANREAMDLYNNRVGRGIMASHPDASVEQIGTLIGRAMIEGQLIVMDGNGQLAWSDQVGIGKHRLSPNETIEAQLPTPAVVPAAPRDPHRPASPPAESTPIVMLPDEAGHPLHALHQQCSSRVESLDQQLGLRSSADANNIKASLTTLAVANGFERVDHVVLSEHSGTEKLDQKIFIVQGDLRDPAHLRSQMPVDQARTTPANESFRELQQIEQRQASVQYTAAMATPQQDEPSRGARTLGG